MVCTVRIGRSQRVIGYREGDACYCAWIGLPPGVEQRRMKCARRQTVSSSSARKELQLRINRWEQLQVALLTAGAAVCCALVRRLQAFRDVVRSRSGRGSAPSLRCLWAAVCGVSDVAALTFDHIQQRDGSLVHSKCAGKHGRFRTTPMPNWVKVAIDAWPRPAPLFGAKYSDLSAPVTALWGIG